MVRVFACSRRDVRCHRYGARAMARRQIRRQATGAPECHRVPAQTDSAPEDQTREDQAASTIAETRVRRRGDVVETEVRTRAILETRRAPQYPASTRWFAAFVTIASGTSPST